MDSRKLSGPQAGLSPSEQQALFLVPMQGSCAGYLAYPFQKRALMMTPLVLFLGHLRIRYVV